MFTFSLKPEIRRFHVVVVQKLQSVMHVRSLFLLIKPIGFFDVLVAVALLDVKSPFYPRKAHEGGVNNDVGYSYGRNRGTTYVYD